MRPEHLNEALLVRRRAVASRLLRAVAGLVREGAAGGLPASARWIFRSRAAFLRKHGTDVPRPIRAGELWRRVIAKRLMADGRERIQKLLVEHRQCGVAPPGSATPH